jgi:hypothetical protein
MRFYKLFLLVILTFSFSPKLAYANFISEQEALEIAKNWAISSRNPMNETIGDIIRESRHYYGKQYGTPGYYAVFFAPKGWVIIPADDHFEPILAFGGNSLTPKEFEESLISKFFHVQGSVASVSKFAAHSSSWPQKKIQNRWDQLRSAKIKTLDMQVQSNELVTEDLLSDLVVKPLLGKRESKLHWRQQFLACYDQSGAIIKNQPIYRFYNFKTQWNSQLAPYGYPVGCLNLNIGQIMAFLAERGQPTTTYPTQKDGTSAVGIVPTFLIDRELVSLDFGKSVLGGSSDNGAYDWDKITYPFNYLTDADKLTHDGNSGNFQDSVRNEIAIVTRYWIIDPKRLHSK